MSEGGGHGIEASVLRDVLVFLVAALTSLQLSALVLESTGTSAAEAAGIVAAVRAEHYASIAAAPATKGEGKADA